MKKIALILSLALVLVPFSLFIGCGGGVNRTQYQIDCVLDGDTLSGEQTVRYFNDTENSITQLKFNLFGNAFRDGAKYNPISAQYLSAAYPNGINYGGMEIISVTQDGDAVKFQVCGQDQNILAVSLKNEVFPSESVEVVIKYTLKLANVVSRTGWTEKVVNLGNFYPILCGYDGGFYECVYYAAGDPFFSDCADYVVKLTCDKEYNVAASGKLFEKIEDGSTATATYKIDNARSFALVLSCGFESAVDRSTGTEITYYFYDDSEPDKSLSAAVKAFKLFSEKFGEYPYPTYSVVQTEFVQGGMEYPALVMISDKLEPKAYYEVIAHETAHQWWQSVVGNNEIEHGFLDEGLAEYSVVLFYENYPEYGMKREQLIENTEKTYKIFCSVSDKLFGKVNTVMNRSLKDFTSEYEYVNMAYVKPCIMYEYLRKTVGDKAFFAALRKYYSHFAFKNAAPDDLVGVFEKCGADTNGFFESFFNGKVII